VTVVETADVRVAFFDIDGTLTVGGDVWKPLVHSPQVSGWRKGWLYGAGLPHYGLSRAGLVSQARFRDRWVHLMVWLMARWPVQQVHDMCDVIVQERLVPALRADMVEVLHQHKARGHHVVLVSTMFEEIGTRFAQEVGADAALGSRLELVDGVYTGRIVGRTCSGGHKVAFSRDYLQRTLPDVSVTTCTAYADSRSDIPFLQGMGHPVATYPDDAMRKAATAHGWTVYEGGLTQASH
jgi:HAD superfamily hydrolase (TIGR01490 family)